MLLICFVIVCVLFLIHFSIHNPESAKLINKIPGPKIWPIIGNGFDFLSSQEDVFNTLRQIGKSFPKICKVWICHVAFVNIYNAHDAEILLSNIKYIEKNFIYNFVHAWLREGLLTSKGKKWHLRRKILTPSFHFNILRQFCIIFEKQGNKLVETLNKEVGKTETELDEKIRYITLHSICETAMGADLDVVGLEKKEKYEKSIHQMSKYIIHRMMRVWLFNQSVYDMTSMGKQEKKTLYILHKFTADVIKKRRIARNSRKIDVIEDNDPDDIGAKKRMVFLDMLLEAEAEGRIDEDGIREEVDTFMFEGHETITIALTCCLMELANNPNIQANVLEEILEVFPDSTTPLTIENLNKLQYMERCVKETMRLYPSVTTIGREIHEDMQLKDYLIPKGSTCFVHVFDLHRDPTVFSDPEKFDPERFSKENILNRHPYAYLPFSAGPRNCIGQRFAMFEMKVLLVSILRKFKLESITRPQDLIFTADIVLKFKDPIKVKIIANDIYE